MTFAVSPGRDPLLGTQSTTGLVGFALGVIPLAVGQTLTTQHVREDDFVTFKHSRNLVEGHGMASPEVVAIRREKKVGFVSILPELKPEWLVLRPGEVDAMAKSAEFRDHDTSVTIFNARPRLVQQRRIPGQSYVENDAVFTIFRRHESVNPPVPAG